ncbi:hypothetical protein CANCADRAFT_128801 [Tortispora caseinolytica NRRL Y-17796]|uniref:tRNA (adenine(58)-N(1))-methyltransferase non-catalytic subunit TRM6 n=1 Tax=Tortispora caseinolytica NRRL Y-17796 TaxID=767744 RepID=A0A1E4TAR6_9ASCO|nr:hypothetical protein CANCADRAFT_128801 [Tortispora caseinolytica NRRL Y-17796]
MGAIIKPDAHLILYLPSGNHKIVKVSPGRKVPLGKFGSFDADQILGHPFGLTYEIDNQGCLTVVDSLDSVVDEATWTDSEDNRMLVDDPDSQKMTMDEIETLKKDKQLTGQEIVAKVIESHSAFNKKTAFSQEKYIQRKAQKFLKRFRTQSIGSNELMEYYNAKDPARIMDLRMETLGLMLSLANVQPGGTYLIVDGVSSLVVCAVLERLGPEGQLVLLHENEMVNLEPLQLMGIDLVSDPRVKPVSFLKFLHPEEFRAELEFATAPPPQEQLDQLKTSQRNRTLRRYRKAVQYKNIVDLRNSHSFDALLIATTLQVSGLVQALIPFVHGSRSIVVYHPCKEPLVDLEENITRPDNRLIATQILESAVRPYQSVPGRFHPHMSLERGGGYILHCLRAYPTAVQAQGRR